MFNGTCLQGYVTATYDEIVEVFGEPSFKIDAPVGSGEEDKVETEWEIIGKDYFGNEIPVTIYDWKCYDCGTTSRSGKPFEWHIGGTSKHAEQFVIEKMAMHGV